jgi:hypothetical protein
VQKIAALAEGMGAVVNGVSIAGLGVLWAMLHADWDVLIETDGWSDTLEASAPLASAPLKVLHDRRGDTRRVTPERRSTSERRGASRDRRGARR